MAHFSSNWTGGGDFKAPDPGWPDPDEDESAGTGCSIPAFWNDPGPGFAVGFDGNPALLLPPQPAIDMPTTSRNDAIRSRGCIV